MTLAVVPEGACMRLMNDIAIAKQNVSVLKKLRVIKFTQNTAKFTSFIFDMSQKISQYLKTYQNGSIYNYDCTKIIQLMEHDIPDKIFCMQVFIT